MAETLLNQQEQKPEQIVDRQKQNASLRIIIGAILSVIMVVLTAYVLNLQNQNYHILTKTSDLFEGVSAHQASNYRAYVKQYKDTKAQLEETTRKLEIVKAQLDEVSAQLNTTKGMLSDTQAMLTSAQAENAKLRSEIQELEALRNSENVSNIPELEAKIKNLKQTNVEVSSQLNSVKAEMRAFEADFSSMDEGKSLIVLFQNKINLVKSRMRYLKQEAYYAKIAAQKEKDRIAALNGNSGFMVRDGLPVRTNNSKGFAIDVKIVQ